MFRRKRTVSYYRTGAASYGFQAEVKKFGYALFFMTQAGLNYLDTSGGWAIGSGPSLVVVDQGLARSLTTTTLRSDAYAFVFDQQGLMGGIGYKGIEDHRDNAVAMSSLFRFPVVKREGFRPWMAPPPKNDDHAL